MERRDAIACITINRPKQLNALNSATIAELSTTIKSLDNDNSIRCIIITGAENKAFVAGADIKEFAGFSKAEGEALSRKGHQILFDLLENCSKPTIAAINGFALGGGLELAMACHIRLASDNAKMGLPEVSLGLIPGYGGTQRLTKLVGKTNAMEMILSGEMIDSQKALNLRLVNKVVERNNLFSSITELAKKIMRNSPNAIANAITSINAAQKNVEGFEIEKEKFSECFESKDFKEGVSAFLNKRKPSF